MRKVKIQMAGIRNLDEALACVELGCDIIGLLVGQEHFSDDFLTLDKAKEIADGIRGKAELTLITHLTDSDKILNFAKILGTENIQLHSDISESEVEKIRRASPKTKLFRVIHILQNGTILTDLKKFKYVDCFFTDSINLETNQVGGTGLVHDFRVDKQLCENLDKPLILAGGLTPQNVKDAVLLVKPYAVDVNSGCKKKDGGRDLKKVEEFVEEVHKAEMLI